jgi:hypothetical protein
MTVMLPGRWLATLALLGPFAALGAQEKVDKRFAATPDISMRLNGGFGTLRIIGWDKDSVVLTGTLARGARIDGGFGFNPPSRGGKFYIDAPNELAATSRLELRVPARATVWAKGGSAEIEATGVSGALDLNIVGGSVRVSGSPRQLTIESMDGNVTIDGSPEWLRVKTASGGIEMRGGSADVGLSTVSGTIRVSKASNGTGTIERGRFEAVTGDILFASDPARAGSLSFDTHSGRIEIALSPKAGADIDALSVTGTIENGMSKREPAMGHEGRGQEIGLFFGDGAARLVVRSFKGVIALRVR